MATCESINLPHLQAYPLHVMLYKDVKNASFLRQQLLDGNTDFEYAFLDATMIMSREHALAACFRAINDMTNNRLRSRNVHSEIVFSLSSNNNIAESFRRFGISDQTSKLVAIKVGTSPEVTCQSVTQHLTRHVEGESVGFSDFELAQMRDLARLRKVYKFDLPKDASTGDIDAAISFVLGTMALKGS